MRYGVRVILESTKLSADKVTNTLKHIGNGNMLKGAQNLYKSGFKTGAALTLVAVVGISAVAGAIYNIPSCKRYRIEKQKSKIDEGIRQVNSEEIEAEAIQFSFKNAYKYKEE